MKSLIAASTILLVISLGNPWEAPDWADEIENPRRAEAKATSEGEDLYFSYCWSCHGEGGTGAGPASGTITTTPTDLTSTNVQEQTDGALYWKMSNGRDDMAPYDRVLTEDQRWALVNYIRTLSATE